MDRKRRSGVSNQEKRSQGAKLGKPSFACVYPLAGYKIPPTKGLPHHTGVMASNKVIPHAHTKTLHRPFLYPSAQAARTYKGRVTHEKGGRCYSSVLGRWAQPPCCPQNVLMIFSGIVADHHVGSARIPTVEGL